MSVCDALVIGGSAGAIEGVCAVLRALPAGFGAAVVVVLHVPRGRPSTLATVLAPHARMPVEEADDKQPLRPGTVYVAPPDYHLLIDDGPVFALSIDEPHNFSMPSIDLLFESAAHTFGARLAAVVLSGGNADGAAGLRTVCDAGGRAFVQAPAEAQVHAMPSAALEACPEAVALPLDVLGMRLAGLAPGRSVA